MEGFPFDIIVLILEELWQLQIASGAFHYLAKHEKSFIAPYALISRQWQYAVNSRLFKIVRITNTDLDEFAAVFADVHRRQSLRGLTFDNIVDNVRSETHDDGRTLGRRWARAAAQQVFRTSISRLLSILRGWADNVEDGFTVRYALGINAGWHKHPGDSSAHTLIREPVDITSPGSTDKYMNFGSQEGIIEGRQIAAVHALDITGEIHPAAACRLTALFPNVERLELRSGFITRNRPEKRAEHRRAMAEGLTSLHGGKLPKLDFLIINGYGSEPKNHSFKCQSFVGDQDDGVDPLCEAIRKLAQPTTRILLVRGIEISPDLFRDRRASASGSSGPAWPALQTLQVQASCVTADGRWLFTGDPDTGVPMENDEGTPRSWHDDALDEASSETDDESVASDDDDWPRSRTARAALAGDAPVHYYRHALDPETFGELARTLTAVVQGGDMPRLQLMWLRVEPDGPYKSNVSIEYGLGTEAQARWWVLKLVGGGAEVLEDTIKEWRAWVGEEGGVDIQISSGESFDADDSDDSDDWDDSDEEGEEGEEEEEDDDDDDEESN